MRIVLDENLPRALIGFFVSNHQVTTVQELGVAGIANGALLALLEGNYDVFVTADKNLRYQQNLGGRRLAIVELPTNRLPVLEAMKSEIVAAVTSASPGTYRPAAVATPP
ncbi:MAG TPA: DUF5615 family PIN-like protein [Pirellulales bacterium]|nr:DUF5615 family PIN-like protein [Pirellulales bacterium]